MLSSHNLVQTCEATAAKLNNDPSKVKLGHQPNKKTHVKGQSEHACHHPSQHHRVRIGFPFRQFISKF
jgi:hypothetical protein